MWWWSRLDDDIDQVMIQIWWWYSDDDLAVMMIHRWWSRSSDDLDPVMKKTWRWRWIEDEEYLKMKNTLRWIWLEDEDELMMIQMIQRRIIVLINCVNRIPSYLRGSIDVFVTSECIHLYILCLVPQCLFWEVSIMYLSHVMPRCSYREIDGS